MGNKYDSLVEEINKQEEVKEQKANLDNELQLLLTSSLFALFNSAY